MTQMRARRGGWERVFAQAAVCMAVALAGANGFAQTVYYWDTNGSTAGFGSASGTWGGSAFFSTSSAGTVATTSPTTSLTDELNFGTAAAGFANGAAGTVTISGSQSIRSLVFGSQSGTITLTGGTLGLSATGTITTNQAAANTNTFATVLAGATTSLTKAGVGTAIFTQANTYTGTTNVTAGTLTLGGASGSILSSSAITVAGGTLTLDNATSNNNDRLGSGAAVTLNAGATLLFNGNEAAASTTESFGNLGFDGGQATVTLGNTGTGQLQTLAATSVTRAAGAVALVRGSNLQTAATNATRLTVGGTAGTGLVFVGAGTSAVGTATNGTDKTLRIVPYLVGDTSVAGNGSSFLTYDVNATAFGLRPLATGEYTTLSAAYTTPATAENVSAFNGSITAANPTVNSLRFATASQSLNGSGTLTVNSGAILAAASGGSIGSGFSGLSLGNGTSNEGVIHVASGNTFAVNAPINVTGGGGLTKGLAGNLTLNAVNTYTGNTVVNTGNLTLGAGGLLGSGSYAGGIRTTGGATLTLTNTAAQVLSGSVASAGLLTLNAPGAVSFTGGLATSAGVTVAANAGTMQVAGSWTNGGAITIPANKTLSFAGGTLASPQSTTIQSGGTFAFASGSAAFGFVPMGSSPAVITNASATFLQTGGTVAASGGQGMWLGSNNSVGRYTITGGSLEMTGSIGGESALVIGYNNGGAGTTSSGTLTIDGDSALVRVLTTSGGLRGGHIISSWGGGGSGNVTNSTINLSRGELQFGSWTLNTSTAAGTINNAGFNFGGASGTATIRPVAGSMPLSIDGRVAITLLGSNGVLNSTNSGGTAGSITINGPIGESGGRQSLTVAGSGTTRFNGANTYTGTTLLTGGTLELGSVNALQNTTLDAGGVVTFVGGSGTYAFGGLAGAASINNGGNTLRIGGNGESTTYSGGLTGSGGLVKAGGGTLSLSGSLGLTGTATLGSGIVAFAGVNATPTSGWVTFAGGTARYDVANVRDISGRIVSSGSAIVIDTAGQSVTYASALAASNTGGLMKAGAGTLALGGANAFSGPITIESGTLQVGTGGTSGSLPGPVTAHGTLAFNRSDATTFGQVVSGSGGVATLGAGAVTLNAVNTYAGDTLASAGGLVLGASGLLGSGSYAGGIRTTGGATLTLTNTAAQVLSGSVASAGLLTLNAPGAVSLTGDLATSAGVTVAANAGTMQVAGSWTNGGAITLPVNKTLSFASGTFASPRNTRILGGGTFAFASGSAAIGFVPMATETALLVDGSSSFLQTGGTVAASGGNGMWLGNLNQVGRYTITGGQLLLTGSQAGGPSLTIGYNNGGAGTTSSGTLTIDGDSALVRVMTTSGGLGGGNITSSWGGGGAGNVTNSIINVPRGELQFGPWNVSAGAGATVNAGLNFGGATGTATIRPVAGSTPLSIASGVAITLLGSNGVLNSTNSGGTAGSITINGPIGESGGRQSLTVAGLGTTRFNGANTYTGTTLLTGGTLALGSVSALQNTTLDAGGVVTFVGGSGTYALGGLAGAASINNGGNTLRIGGNGESTTYSGGLTGSGGLVKAGGGTLTLSALNGFSGAATISGGRLVVAPTGGFTASSGITLAGGELRYDGTTALSRPITLSSGVLSGTGTIASAVVAGANAVLSPGNSPGRQAFSAGLTWSGSGSYLWETNDLAGTAGQAWDLLEVTGGTFSLAGLSSGDRFVLDVTTLTAANQPGPLATEYVPGSSYAFAIASYAGASLALPAGLATAANTDLSSLFDIRLGGWAGTAPRAADIAVRINAQGTGIDLVIVPEPAGLALAAAGIGLAWWQGCFRRRRAGNAAERDA